MFPDNNAYSNNNPDDTTVTICNILQYCIKEKWLSETGTTANRASTKNNSASQKYYSGNLPDSWTGTLYDICEELELISRDSSNDEGQSSSVPHGERFSTVTEHPDTIAYEGCRRSVLRRIPMPQPDYESPIPEHTPGYMQKAFPFIFRSGDGDPFQPRPVDIKRPKTSWQPNWLDWIARLPEVQKRPDAMFMLNGRAQRIACRQQATIAIINAGISREDNPTVDELLHDPQKCDEL